MNANSKRLMIGWGIFILILLIGLAVYFSLHKSVENVGVHVIENPVASTTTPVVEEVKLFKYFEVMDGCDVAFVGECVNVRGGPGAEYKVVSRLRTGVVLKIAETVNKDGQDWYKVEFAHGLLYPERVKGGWYVRSDLVRMFEDDGDHLTKSGDVYTGSKRIVVDVSEEKLYAYDGDKLFMEESISTGLEFTPTPRGTFAIFKMTPSRFMQGPIPGVSDQVYDLPGVPWDMYFTSGGAVIHGAYWHDKFGQPWSHGCVNLPPQKAKELYLWAGVGMPVTIKN